MIQPVILVHGGAGDIPDSRDQGKLDGVRRAARAGFEALSKPGATVLDAVEVAVRVMEDDEYFNAGYGSVLTLTGHVEMDAIIMEGKSLRTGAVAGITNVSNPVSVARLVMETTPHILLTGPTLNTFAAEHGIPIIDEDKLITDYARQALDEFLHDGGEATSELGKEKKYGTVGAVAIDSKGQTACATSTGGMTGKMPGRVGDTPLVGSGAYSDDLAGSCSSTGHGESIAKVCLCRHITGLMGSGHSAQEATEKSLAYMHERTGGTGGAITISNKGDVGISFNSKKMAWAYIQEGKLHYGINQGDNFVEEL